MQRRKGIWINLALVLIIVVVAFLAWAISKDYRYKKYVNEGKGFSVKYPATWIISDLPLPYDVLFLTPLEDDMDVYYEMVNIMVVTFGEVKITNEEYNKLTIDQLQAIYRDKMTIVELNPQALIDGRNAFRFVFIAQGYNADTKILITWLKEEDTVYQITYTALASHYENYIKQVNTMIDSFRILNYEE